MQISEESSDLRVRRTRKLLQQAFIELTVEKGFAAITVRDITDRAMVNRSTFYRHYLDKYDLLQQYMDEVYALVSANNQLEQKTGTHATGGPSGLLNLLRHVQQNAAFYRVMLGVKGDPVFTQRFRQNAENRFRHLLTTEATDANPNGPPIELRLGYVSYAGIGALLWWLENDQPCSVEQLASWLGQLNSASVGLVIKR